MSRRTGGYSSLQRHLDQVESYSTLSSSLASQQTLSLSHQLSTFQSSLSHFSSQHRHKILNSPQFRTEFSQLCRELGVDPLGGGSKGLWDKMGVGDWYYALGVQIVDVCLTKRERGGGLVALDEVIREVRKLRSNPATLRNNNSTTTTSTTTTEITESDVQRAIETLEPLGCGYSLLVVGGKKVLKCSGAAGGLDRDSLVVIEAASNTGRGCVTREEIWSFTASGSRGEREREGEETTTTTMTNWTMDRVDHAIEKALMDDGLVWVDEYSEGPVVEREYWVPGLFLME